jgi:hypothetical protein
MLHEIGRPHFDGKHEREVSRDQPRLRIVRPANFLDPTSIVVGQLGIGNDR